MSNLGKKPIINQNVLFVSMTNAANGAENVLFMAASAIGAPMMFAKKIESGGLDIPSEQTSYYASSNSMLVGFFKLIKLLKSYRKDFILISTHPYLNAYLGFLKRVGYIKSQLIVRECTSVFTRFTGLKKLSYKLAYYLGYPGVDLVVCQTSLMRCQFLQHINFIPSQKIIVQGNPINLKLINTKAKLLLNDPDATGDFICAAGRLIPEKGFSVLIHAFSRIEKEYPNLKLLILGEGGKRTELNRLIETLGLTHRVILKGRVNNPIPYFKRARICVLSSIKEGFPNVLLEMMAVNPSVVATLCAGGIEAIPGVLKVKPDSINELVIGIKKVLDESIGSSSSVIKQYLHKRTPPIFINSLLKSLYTVNNL
jgi:glycosyltransferase involved in cell wall biosynthesis